MTVGYAPRRFDVIQWFGGSAMEFRYGTGQGRWPRGNDLEATEVIPRLPHSVAADASAALPDEVTSTRPLPRIDDAHPAASVPARPRRAPARAAVAGAVLLACAGVGLAVGGLLSGRDGAVPKATAAEDGEKAAPSEAPSAGGADARGGSYRVTIRTSDADGAGTDCDVQGRLTDAEGRTSPWTVLDTSDHDDFEAGGTDTYTIAVPADFGRPVTFQLWKAKGDDWAPYARTRITGPDGFEGLWGGEAEAERYWLTDDSGTPGEDDEQEGVSYGPYSPEWAVTAADD
ncbi:PLAT/LH2 domain-containing protein [Streptomyces sp. NPDC048604]|uniref:PLAT/LH2 domain-containing protein n=1 Tax=Streptomyces sp. NPDC048604 TaxID=3365578 RepID=UPI00371D5104